MPSAAGLFAPALALITTVNAAAAIAAFGNSAVKSIPCAAAASRATSDGPAASGERSPVRRPRDCRCPRLRCPEARLSSLCGEGLEKSVETDASA